MFEIGIELSLIFKRETGIKMFFSGSIKKVEASILDENKFSGSIQLINNFKRSQFKIISNWIFNLHKNTCYTIYGKYKKVFSLATENLD